MDDNLIFGTPNPNQQNVQQNSDFSNVPPAQQTTSFPSPQGPPPPPPPQNSSVPMTENIPHSESVIQPEPQAAQFPSLEQPVVDASSPPPPPPVATTPPLDSNQGEPAKSFFSLGSILKILIGIIVVIVAIFLIVKFLLPMFNKTKSGNASITYWGLFEDASIMQSVISDFEKENPTIKVSYVKQDVKQYRERLTTRISNGTGPDVFRFHNTWYPMLSKSLLPVPTDIITTADFKKSFYQVAQKDLIKNGAIYGIPLEIDTLALYVNDDLFKSAGAAGYPKTWEEFINTARKLTVKDENGKIEKAGAAMGTFDNISHAPDIISMLFLQNGVNLDNISSTGQETSDALKFYTDFATTDGNIWDNTLDNSILAFAKGNLAMFFGYSWDAFTIKAMNPNLNFKVAEAPQLISGKVTIASYWAEGVSAKSKYQKESLLFLKFLTQKETSQKLFTEQSKTRMYGEPYARVELGDSLKANDQIYPFVNQGKSAESSFLVDSTFDEGLNTKSNGYLQAAVNSILKNTSPQTASETLISGINQVLQQYGK
jgi:multiple sugar transport system substrate-binding protein